MIGHHWLQILFGLDKEFNRLWDQLTRKKPFDKAFLDQLYLMRSEVLHWCEKEFREPPACWMPQGMKSSNAEPAQEASDDNDGWYEKITQPRRDKVACLEVAKHLWEQNPELSYEQVRLHPVMVQAGLRYVFTNKNFKRWAHPVAPDEAKRGGRRTKSGN